MHVEEIVKEVVAQMHENVDYLYMNWAQANVAIDNIKKPTIVYILPPSGKMFINHGSYGYDKPDAQIAFLCSTEFDFDGEKNEDLVESMKMLLLKFVGVANQSGLLQEIEGDIKYKVVYDHLDDNVTGIIAEIPLVPEESIPICKIDTLYEESE